METDQAELSMVIDASAETDPSAIGASPRRRQEDRPDDDTGSPSSAGGEAATARRPPGGLEAVVDAMAFGILAVDDDWRVHYANRFARRVLATNDGLGVQDDRLVVRNSREAERLRKWLRAGRDNDAADPPAALALARASGRMPYVLGRIAFGRRPDTDRVGWLLLIDPESSPAISTALLRQMFELTPMEARLALALFQGVKLAQFADEHGIAIGTARRHLEHVRKKTRTTRQADLVHLIAACAVPLESDATADPGDEK